MAKKPEQEIEKPMYNKSDFVSHLAKKATINKDDAVRWADCVIDSIKEMLAEGSQLRFIGFGTFVVTRQEAREGRNPQTGEPIKIPAANALRFRPSKEVKELLNKK